MKNLKQIAEELKENLQSKLPGLIQKVILYGSHVSGKANENSDIDLLLLLNKDIEWQTKECIYDICNNINLKYDVWIDVNWIPVDDLNSIRGKQPFVQNALNEGITV
ncbi:MAG: nucleotidyltransferase domain-containing protein [Phaeovulum sp.]|jgi:predicted nucleotidyltransferase|uniref:nucleotidyltransferase domain-containing protein n=1 Tax=Phaeovulum sp. TaxID=2934796 RepID=UPI00273343BA|nr:nucleotidyltransferase domain-containing protein [Phaeovulum sp.]MDP2300937.1 nucleotidyltransferase domain-containing protein [Ignavibacteria bacterium]MDP3861548.1 nucleotidyltransferase domain-containing protein [Phaeovulum sp.]